MNIGIASIVLIALAGIHITEEGVKGFRSFLNTKWFPGNVDCPVSRKKGLFVDQIGLFLLLTVLAFAGAQRDSRWLLVAVGIVAADLVQHAIFSIAVRDYTPGVATSALYLLYVIYFFDLEEVRQVMDRRWAWAALAAGAAVIAINYLMARRKVLMGRCRQAASVV